MQADQIAWAGSCCLCLLCSTTTISSRGGDVVDALALGVAAAAGAGLADEVLLRVAGDLRRRARLHRPPRDVAPVAAPVLL
jgi:hypothetical protein